jgi:hypothetical protein
MDLVALIGINNLAKRGEIQDYRKSLINFSTRLPSTTLDEEKVVIGPSFKFVLYISFPHRGDSLGLELCEALSQFNKANGQSNFEVVIRLSREGINAGRWD